MIAAIIRLVFIFWMVCPFPYFITLSANTFTVPSLRDNGAILGYWSFVSGMLCVLLMGLFHGLLLPLAVCGAIMATCALMLYEWARRTVTDRQFYIGLSGEVPPAVCTEGPYRYVRHPFYLSYMIAFVAMAVTFPSFVTVAVCLVNIGLFVYMAIDDEKVLLRSGLRAEYLKYRGPVGMFLPRLAAS
jgi:protein-S-isoprenylcysteine O-methyltransferase Ste14